MIDRTIALAAARFVIASQYGDPFEQCGFAGAVLAGDDGNRPIEAQLEIIQQKRQTERIGRSILNSRRIEPDPFQIWRWQIDGAISS